jgi:ribosomal protein S18 acetylase RimI-like enzyme
MLGCMGLENARPRSIKRATEVEVAGALKLIFQRARQPTRSEQVVAALDEIERSPKENRILLAARRDGESVGAVWSQIRAGRVAALWPPGLADSEQSSTAVALVNAAIFNAAKSGVRLIHSLLAEDQLEESVWLTGCGFKKAADLQYLVCPRAKFPSDPPRGGLIFEPICELSTIEMSQEKLARLAHIIERTYEKSLDCPVLRGVRSIEDVIAGYQGTGEFNPSQWFFVRHPQRESDIGCLLLAEHPREARSEIVYMGVSPEERGSGWGLEIVRYAQWLAGTPIATSAADKELVLAVDGANRPAVRVYERAGFECHARRNVFLRVIDS